MSTRRTLVAAGITALVAAGSLLAAAPASAAPAYCSSGYACIWGDGGFKTGGNSAALVKFEQYIPQFSQWNYAGTSTSANNSASSVWNNGNSESATFYKDLNKGGAAFSLPVNTGDSEMHDSSGLSPAGFQDTLGSGYFASFV